MIKRKYQTLSGNNQLKYRKRIRKRFSHYILNAFFINCYNKSKSICAKLPTQI